MMRLHNAPAELLEKIAAHVGVQVVILDPDWHYVGFEEIPVPEQEQQAAEAAKIDEWLGCPRCGDPVTTLNRTCCQNCGYVWNDPRTEAQKALDDWQADASATRRMDEPR